MGIVEVDRVERDDRHVLTSPPHRTSGTLCPWGRVAKSCGACSSAPTVLGPSTCVSALGYGWPDMVLDRLDDARGDGSSSTGAQYVVAHDILQKVCWRCVMRRAEGMDGWRRQIAYRLTSQRQQSSSAAGENWKCPDALQQVEQRSQTRRIKRLKGVRAQVPWGKVKGVLRSARQKHLQAGYVAAFFALVRRVFLLHSCRVARQSVMATTVSLQLLRTGLVC